MNSVCDESSVMTLLALSRRRLSDDPLGEQGINTAIDSCAMRLDVPYIHID